MAVPSVLIARILSSSLEMPGGRQEIEIVPGAPSGKASYFKLKLKYKYACRCDLDSIDLWKHRHSKDVFRRARLPTTDRSPYHPTALDSYVARLPAVLIER